MTEYHLRMPSEKAEEFVALINQALKETFDRGNHSGIGAVCSYGPGDSKEFTLFECGYDPRTGEKFGNFHCPSDIFPHARVNAIAKGYEEGFSKGKLDASKEFASKYAGKTLYYRSGNRFVKVD